MTDQLDTQKFVRIPFQVKATQITEENIEAVAELVGDVAVKDGERYIKLNRRIIPNVPRAYIGWYVTILGDNLRCYSPKVFDEQFMSMPENSMMTWSFPEDPEDKADYLTQDDFNPEPNDDSKRFDVV